MKIMKKILPVLLLCVLGGCIEDKGVYVYNELLKMQVSVSPPSAALIEGESKGFTGMVYILDENNKIREDVENVELAYEWQINSEIVSTDSRYLFEAKEQGEFDGYLRVSDVTTGATYGYPFHVSVTSPYETGFLVLSEEGGHSALHMIRSSKISGDYYLRTNDTLLFKDEYMNVFEHGMGEVLEGKPLSITEHHAINESDVDLFGEITIMTDNNGKRIVQDLNGLTLRRETFITQEFSANGLPDNFNPRQTLFTAWDNYVLDEDGRVYARRVNDASGYHLGTFDKEIPLYGTGRFSDLIPAYYPKFYSVLALEWVDGPNGKKQRNYIGIYESKGDPATNQKRLTFIAPEDSPAGYLDDFIDVKEEIVFSDYYKDMYWEPRACQFVILKNDAGEFILHQFNLLQKNKTNILVEKSQKINLTQTLGITNVVSMFAFKNTTLAYFCDETNIYVYDPVSNKIDLLGTSQNAKITAMGGQTTENSSHRDNKCENSIALGMDDGTVVIYEVGKVSHNELGRCVFVSENNYGKIKQIIYKVGRSNRFNN